MKIQTPNVKLNNQRPNKTKDANQNVSFTGAMDVATQALRFLDTNKAWGANFVDFGFMVTPRTAVDFTRGPDAGFETMRREATGNVNHSLVGAYGMGAAYLLSQKLNNDYKIDAHKLFANDDTIDILGNIWHAENKSSGTPLKGFLDKVFGGVKGFNPNLKSSEDGWVELDKTTKNDVVEILSKEINKKDAKKLSKETQEYLKARIGYAIGADGQLKLKNESKEIVLSLETFIDNVYKLSKSFISPEVSKVFNETAEFSANTFANKLKHLNKKTSLLGIGIAATLGICTQPFNMYLTKKKTGKTGFVGGEGRKADNSNGFKLMKVAAAAAFGTIVLSTLGKPAELIKAPKKLLKLIQFKGFHPAIEQLKVIYGVTIISRLFSARDKDELREASIKDTLGFLNWMVLGSFVTKFVAAGFEKYTKLGDNGKNNHFFKYEMEDNGKGLWDKIKRVIKSDLVTRDEVLYEALKKAAPESGEAPVVKGMKALSFKEMVELANKSEISKYASKKIKLLNVAQLAGYAYSGLVLGIGIPKLNIAITKHFNKARKENNENKKAFYETPSNLKFLNQKTQDAKSFTHFASAK